MTTKDEALKLALEAMNLARAAHGQMLLSEPPQEAWKAWGVSAALTKAMTAASEALAEQPAQQPHCDDCGGFDPKCPLARPAQQQESCGWRMRHNGVWAYSFTKDAWDFIYAVSPAARKAARDNAPASKPWVGLSTIELDEIDAPIRERGHATIAEIYQAIEAKLREKNA